MKWRLLPGQISTSSTTRCSSETEEAPLKRLGVRHLKDPPGISQRRLRGFPESGLTVSQLSNAMWGFALRISFEFLPLSKHGGGWEGSPTSEHASWSFQQLAIAPWLRSMLA
jgi:hypothetical protein